VAGYCDIDDVRQWMPGGQSIDQQTGNPTAPTVIEWIDQVANQVNAAFKEGGASVPPGDVDVLGDLKLKCARELAYQVMTVRGAIGDDDTVPLFREWHEDFKKLLELIAAGEYGATTGDTDVPWSHTRDADTADPSDDRNPVFTKDYVP